MNTSKEYIEDYLKYGTEVVNYCKYHYERDLQTHTSLLNYLNNDSVIFDIGSNIGLFSKIICKNKKYKKLHCFEPVNRYYNICKEELKDYPDIIHNNFGLSNKEDKLTIYKCEGSIGWNSFLLKDPNQPQGLLPINNLTPEVCKVITLDSYCKENNIKKIDFIKIDVEGFECNVLEGFLQTLSMLDHKPYFFIEVGWGTKHPEWDYCQDIYKKLFEIGYEKIDFTDKTQDILFIPK
jgi:FkbM family methyltransferase